MRLRRLQNQILLLFAIVIAVLGAMAFGMVYYLVKIDVFQRIEAQVERSLESARLFYNEDIRRIGMMLEVADPAISPDQLCAKMRLHYFYRLSPQDAQTHPSELVRYALSRKEGIGGTRLIGPDELRQMSQDIQSRAKIAVKPTPNARPSQKTELDAAMAKEYALPILDKAGQVIDVLCGGRVTNQDFEFVDRIRFLVFGQDTYQGLPIGTVTVFQDDVRISTNVLDAQGQRAIGTRISEAVYKAVVEENRLWLDRAIVVGHWYKAAYEPIYDIQNRIIGVLYVGILEKPFNDRAKGMLLILLGLIAAGSGVALLLGYILSRSIARPLTQLLQGITRVSGGQLGHVIIHTRTPILELHELAKSFNAMSVQLEEREVRLHEQNQKLEESNKSYLDLLGFVAHELKGLLASAIMNAYALRDGFLGMINFKQKKAVDSICRNLDYLAATVTKFLNLSRIERGNLEINKSRFLAKKDLFDIAVQTFAKLIADKQMTVDNRIDPDLSIAADPDLMMIVVNNLVNNAAKYGQEGGQIILSSRQTDDRVEFEVYNDGRPITPEGRQMLFKKFSRLDGPEKKKVKGTGLGLYITKQIIEAHGGQIDVQPKENGNAFVFWIAKE